MAKAAPDAIQKRTPLSRRGGRGQPGLNGFEFGFQLRPNAGDSRNDNHSDQARNQAVFDRGSTAFVAREFQDRRFEGALKQDDNPSALAPKGAG